MKSLTEPAQNELQQQSGQTQTPLQSLIKTVNTGLTSEPPTYDQVDLTDDEKAEALRVARHAKHVAAVRRAYQEELRKEWKVPEFTAEQVFAIIESGQTYTGRQFLFEKDSAYMKLVKNLCCYFTADPRFKGDLKKGLALFGGVGCGKTALMKFFNQNPVHSYRVKSMLEITDDYKQNGEGAVRHYNANLQGVRNAFDQSTFGLCMDEVGIEQIPAPHFAETKNVFAEIIQMRSLNVPTNTTHITSNLSVEDFEGLYGTRVYDRMKEMFNIITFNGIKSFRK